MVIYIAGLLDVPVSLYEAARMDGAGFWAQLFYITIPNIRNTIALAVISCIIFTFGQFSIQYVITKGGPSRSTEILSLLIFRQAFEISKFGYSAAISVLFFRDAPGFFHLPAPVVQVRHRGRVEAWQPFPTEQRRA